jgi:hypothetical protein
VIYDEAWTDALLFGHEEPHVRLVLAATLGHPTREPSITELVEATGLERATVIDSQRQIDPLLTRALDYGRALERGWRPTGDELINLLVARRSGADAVIGLYETPRRTRDSYPKRDGTNALTILRREYDSDLADHPFKVPVGIGKKLPKGSRSNAVRRLILAYYVRQQLIFGAILPDDLATADRLHLHRVDRTTGYEEEPAARQVESARSALLDCGALEAHPSEAGLYVIPGGRPPVRDFYRASFKRARRLALGGFYVERLAVPATDAQAERIRRLIRTLGSRPAELALWPDVIDEAKYDDGYDDHETGGSERAIAALETALSTRRPPQTNVTATPNEPDGHPEPTRRPPASSTSTLDLEPFAPSGREGDSGEEEDGLSGLPIVGGVLVSLYPEGTPRAILIDLSRTLDQLAARNDGEPLSVAQRAAVDQRVGAYLGGLERPTIGQVRAAVRHPVSDDALLDELKRLRPAPELSDEIGRLLDGALHDVPE